MLLCSAQSRRAFSAWPSGTRAASSTRGAPTRRRPRWRRRRLRLRHALEQVASAAASPSAALCTCRLRHRRGGQSPRRTALPEIRIAPPTVACAREDLDDVRADCIVFEAFADLSDSDRLHRFRLVRVAQLRRVDASGRSPLISAHAPALGRLDEGVRLASRAPQRLASGASKRHGVLACLTTSMSCRVWSFARSERRTPRAPCRRGRPITPSQVVVSRPTATTRRRRRRRHRAADGVALGDARLERGAQPAADAVPPLELRQQRGAQLLSVDPARSASLLESSGVRRSSLSLLPIPLLCAAGLLSPRRAPPPIMARRRF